MVLIRHILNWLDEYAPFRYAAKWDQCGLQVGDPGGVVERILVALDPTSEVLDEAERERCQCLITHHPLLFKPVAAVRVDRFPGNLVAQALLKGIHLVAVHTNLDAAKDGTNDQLARILSLHSVEPLEIETVWQGENRYGGMGRVGILPHTMTLGDLVNEVGRVLGKSGMRAVGDSQKAVRRVAVCSGSGGSLVEQVIASSSDVYITGDIKYHEAQRATEAGLALIDVGHFASERVVLDSLAVYLRSQVARNEFSVEVRVASHEKDPFWSVREEVSNSVGE